jgi:hypothetical protein
MSLSVFQGVFPDLVDDVAAESVDSFVEPEAENLFDFFEDFGIVPIEIGLLFAVDMEVVLVDFRHVFPSAAGEDAGPVIGSFSVFAFAPIVIIVVRGVLVFGHEEPRMLVGGVIDDEIHHERDVAFLGFGDQPFHVFHRPVFRIDGFVVGNVIAEIVVGRAVERREPNDVDSESLKVIELGDNAGDIPDSIAIGIAKRTGIDLIDGVIRPIRVFHHILYYSGLLVMDNSPDGMSQVKRKRRKEVAFVS